MALEVGRGQGGDGHQPTLSSPCCARGSQSHIKEMSQLVLNWEVSQAAVRTGMMCGALCGPKQGQTLQSERTGFLGLPGKDLRYSGQAPGDGGVGGCHLALEQSLQVWFPAAEEASSPWPGAVGFPPWRSLEDGALSPRGPIWGRGWAGRLEAVGQTRDLQKRSGIEMGTGVK